MKLRIIFLLLNISLFTSLDLLRIKSKVKTYEEVQKLYNDLKVKDMITKAEFENFKQNIEKEKKENGKDIKNKLSYSSWLREITKKYEKANNIKPKNLKPKYYDGSSIEKQSDKKETDSKIIYVPQGYLISVSKPSLNSGFKLVTNGVATCVGIMVQTSSHTILLHSDENEKEDPSVLPKRINDLFSKFQITSASVINVELFSSNNTSKFAESIKTIINKQLSKELEIKPESQISINLDDNTLNYSSRLDFYKDVDEEIAKGVTLGQFTNLQTFTELYRFIDNEIIKVNSSIKLAKDGIYLKYKSR